MRGSETGSRRIWIAFGALLLLCVLGIGVVLLWRREPSYEGRALSYWLDQLEPTVITAYHSVHHWPDQKFRSRAAASDWVAHTTELHERSARVLQAAGPECLPMLLRRLTTKPTPSRAGFLRQWAYALRLSDSAPLPGEDDTEVRRGQALTAIVLLQDRAAALVLRLSVIAAEDKDDAVHRAASHALYILAPDEFRRIRSPAKSLATAEHNGAANASRPLRSETNAISSAAGSSP